MTNFLGHPREWLAGIHLKRTQDGLSITDVGSNGMDSPFADGIECAKLEHQPPAFNTKEESP